ncbi:maltose alpha-D-glucosyltransferase [Candidatus Viridilinea mediisalina]|uniref:Maltokinase n=1 Tax=Candidatus Viridilinea mediisalina TaxID=2024553 RepID=A0A2A6REZ7_9CHLR|nr:maltose alpha-D-glucosyltransferase [Candidatus Viridilinea mediisalina]PDW01422.1 maltose alpha-D-glucosyltransferase [Candidatus Viridilinea mediisalina]
MSVSRQPRSRHPQIFTGDPLWYKDAIIYEIHVRAFADSGGDGIGDFKGLTSRLDYLQELGITAIWLLPFYPSPLKDDGYDIADYTDVNPSYGDIADVRTFIREAHRRGLRVITELVCNHTSDQHPWFQRARRSRPGTSFRDFYVWSDNPNKYKDARIIFKDFETSNWTWDPVAGAYFWHRFYSHQPDLNFENPAVHRAIVKVMEFWLDMGVDGLRLDAIPYLYEEEGTNCENLPQTHTYLKQLRAHIDEKYPGRMLLAEANQWPEDLISYFGDGDECHMAFHFSVMPRLYMAVHQENRFPIVDIMHQTPSIPDNCQWAIFLRNHDELTLEMVTDEERDYMYRTYASDPQARINLGIRRRLAPLLGNHRRKIELMNGLLFSLPGTPVLYYGDEIGMGDNIYLGDRNGVRTPMQWTGDRNAGFSRANPQRLFLPVITDPEYHYEMVNVENQSANQHSLLWWTRRLIALRKRYKAFGRGTLEFLHPENRKVLVFVRRYEDDLILVIANLSRFVQAVEVDLSAFRGMMPVEMFGQVEFPGITEHPYMFTIGPHSFYWFHLVPQRVEGMRPDSVPTDSAEPELITIEAGGWDAIFYDGRQVQLEHVLPQYMRPRRWFGSKSRKIKSVTISDTIIVPYSYGLAYLVLVSVQYIEDNSEIYLLPMAYAEGERAHEILQNNRHAVIAGMRFQQSQQEPGLIYDPLVDREFCSALLELIMGRRRLRGERGGELAGLGTRTLRALAGTGTNLDPSVMRGEQSNTSINFGGRLIMKLYRKLDHGVNPDLEVSRYLTDEANFQHTPPLAGALEYTRPGQEPTTLGMLQSFVPNEGDAFGFSLDVLRSYFEDVLAEPDLAAPTSEATLTALLDAPDAPPAPYADFVAAHLEAARLLAQRTAELHLALARGRSPAFAPEPFSLLYQRGLFQAMRSQASATFQGLRKLLPKLPDHVRDDATRLLSHEAELTARFRRITAGKIEAARTRIHGDYHLGQVLYTGKDYMIIDFEGEPARPISERRIKRSPLRDVAGMLRSYQYAAYSSLFTRLESTTVSPEEETNLRQWADFWAFWVSAAFLNSYREAANGAPFMPNNRADLETLLEIFILEKAIYEIAYEMNNRPTWLGIPLSGVLRQLETE